MRRTARIVGFGAVAAALLAGCVGPGSMAAEPTWVPKPEGPPPADLPRPEVPGGPPAEPDEPQGPPRGPQAPGQPEDSNVVATGLRHPWGLAVLPDGSAIVGERVSGRILRVQPRRAPARLEMRIGNLDATGDGGLLDLALSPNFREDNLVFAYITTRTDNRVVRFELRGTVTPVLTGIPRGRTGNGGRLAFDPDGNLYVGTGDTGRPAMAADPRNLAGKVLRITTFGRPAADNPNPASLVFSRGHRSVHGLCLDGRGRPYETEVGTGQDEVNQLEPGKDYGWPDSARRPAATAPVRTLRQDTTEPGGCAVIERGLFVTALRGKRLWALPLDSGGSPGAARAVLSGTYGRLRTVVAAPDGALWLTTSNRDPFGDPVPQDDRVIRILPPTNTTNSPT